MKFRLLLVFAVLLLRTSYFAQCNLTPSPTLSVLGSATACASADVSLSLALPPTNVWVEKATYPGSALMEPSGFAIGNKGYIGIGYKIGMPPTDIWEFNPATDTWTQKTDIPVTGKSNSMIFVIGTGAHLLLGDGSDKDHWEYDQVSNAWTQLANPIGNLSSGGIAFALNGKGYVGLGYSSGFLTSDIYEYNPVNNTWAMKNTFASVPRTGAFVFTINGKAYVGSGYDASGNPLYDVWEYDGVSDTWTARSNFAGGGYDYAYGFGIGAFGYVNLINQVGRYMSQYDPITDSWISKTASPDNWFDLSSFVIGGKAYRQTGVGSGKKLWEYCPELTYSWSTGAVTSSISISTSGTYSVMITDMAGCVTTLTQAITVNPSPPVSISGTSTLCAGNGVQLTASGAAGYTWSANAGSSTANTVSLSPITNTTYTVTGTSAFGCTNTATQAVTVYNLPNVTASAVNPVICMGGTTALNGSGATMSYSWTGGVTNSSLFSPTVTTTYTLIGTDFNTCSNTAVQTITVNNLPTVTANATSTVICMNNTVTLSGGGASTYTWTGGVSNGSPFSPTITATYTVTGTDANTCTNTAVRTITVNNLPLVTASTTNSVLCIGYSTTLNGGGAVSYAWTNGVSNSSPFSPTITATYTVTGTDANTCTNTAVQAVTVNNLPNITASAVNPVICIGGTTTLNGGGAVTYTWTNSIINGVVFSPTLTNTYSVTGTDANTCTNTAVQTVTVNALPLVTTSTTHSVICMNQTTTVNGGGAITYTWTNGVTNGAAFSPTITATYTVTGTDANTCTNTAVTTITVNNLPVVTASTTNSVICIGYSTTLNGGGAVTYTWTNGVTNGSAFYPTITATYTVTGTDANTCTNTAVQTVTVNDLPNVTASAVNPVICIGGTTTLNGSGAVTYTWTNSVTNGVVFSPTVTQTYTVTGTDANTCTNTAVQVVTVNALPLVTTSTSNSVICMNQTTTLNGGGAVTYTWTNGVTNGIAFSPTITQTYTVTGTDANTCTNTAVTTITVNNLPVVTASTTNSVLCIGYSTTLNGGGAVTYTWTNAVTNGASFSPTITNTYTVIGTDANTCTNTAVKTITVNNLPNVTASAVNPVICIGGTTTVNGSGAVTYTWTNSVTNGVVFSPTVTQTYTVTGTDANTCTNTAVQVVTVNALPLVTTSTSNSVICMNQTTTLNGGGAVTYTWTNGVTNGIAFSPTITQTYTVTGTDANTCTNTAVRTITVNNLPVVTASTTNSVLCIGYSTTLNGGGAVTYTWTNAVTNSAAFSPTITNTYTVTGTDANTCTNTAVKTITVNNLPVVTASTSSAFICLNYTTSLYGGGALTYTWTNGVTNAAVFSPTITRTYTVTGTDANTCTNTAVQTITVNSLPVVTANTNSAAICYGKFTILYGGGANLYTWSGGITDNVAFSPTITTTYTVTGMDANTCTNTAVRTITVHNLPNVTSVTSNSVICIYKSTTLNGGGAVTYTWTNGVVNSIPFSPTITTTYTVTGTDANTCTNTAVRTITVNNLPVVTASTTNSVLCIGYPTTLNGGGAVTYTWSNGVTNGTAFLPTVTTTYTVTGTDANTCTNTAVKTITVNALPVITASASRPVICLNETTSVSGGGAVTYTWTNGISDAVAFSPTTTLTYTVTGTDVNTCTNTVVQTVTVHALPIVTASASHPVICINATTSVNGAGAVTYTWTNGITDGVAFSPTITGTYTVLGTDANTCTNTAVQSITVNNLPVVTASVTNPVICRGDVTMLSGGGAVTYTWTNNVTNAAAFTPSFTNIYTVTGTDANGCKNTAVKSITVHQLPNVQAYAAPIVICNGQPGTLNGVGALTFTWSNGVANGAPFTPSLTANYSVTGTDGNGCTGTATTAVTVNTVPVIAASTTTNVICRGEYVTFSSTGAHTYTWTGGANSVSPFTPTATTSYTLIGSSQQGCLASNSVVITVTVNPRPVMTINSGAICIGETFTLTPAGAPSYTFTGGSIVVNPTSTTMYTVAGTSAEGCISLLPATGTVTVNYLPVISLGATSRTLCLGESSTIAASGASTYTWSSGDNTTSVVITPTAMVSYTVTGTSVHGCVSSNTTAVQVFTVPTVNVTSNKESVCDGNTVVLSATGAQSYSWNTGGNTPSISHYPNKQITTYTVTGYTAARCSDSKTISVLVYPNPAVAVGPDIEMTVGETYHIKPVQVGGVSFLWASSEGLSSTTELSPVTSIEHTITYTLTVTSANGCTASDDITITVPGELIIANFMTPNGDGKNDTWKVNNNYRVKNCSVEIIDATGKAVFSKKESYENEFDAEGLPEGVYYYFMREGGSLKHKGSITVTR